MGRFFERQPGTDLRYAGRPLDWRHAAAIGGERCDEGGSGMLGRIVSSMAGGRRLGAPVMALALLVLPVPAGAADPLPADAFYGPYQGSGVAEKIGRAQVCTPVT